MYSQLRMYYFSGVCTKLLFFTCMKKTLFVLCIWRHRYLKGPYATQPSPRTKLCVACQQQNMKRQGLNPSSLFIPFSSSVPQLGKISIPREAYSTGEISPFLRFRISLHAWIQFSLIRILHFSSLCGNFYFSHIFFQASQIMRCNSLLQHLWMYTYANKSLQLFQWFR